MMNVSVILNHYRVVHSGKQCAYALDVVSDKRELNSE